MHRRNQQTKDYEAEFEPINDTIEADHLEVMQAFENIKNNLKEK